MILDKFFTPLKSTIEALEKNGYPVEQQRKIWKLWVDNHTGEDYEDLNRKYREVVRKEAAHGIRPDRSHDEAQTEQRKQNFKSKSKDSNKHMQSLRDKDMYQIGESQLKKNCAMLATRFDWDAKKADKWLQQELDKDKLRKVKE